MKTQHQYTRSNLAALMLATTIMACFVQEEAFAQEETSKSVLPSFDEFMKEYRSDISGTLDASALAKRRAVYDANVAMIKKHNAKYERGETSYMMAINDFADFDWNSNSKAFLGGLENELSKEEDEAELSKAFKADEFSASSVPTSIDWRARGKVTPIKHQGVCGSCWAFAATAVMESRYAIATGALRELSEQQLVSCDLYQTQYGNQHGLTSGGCDGGWKQFAFRYIAQNSGINSDNDYTYTDGDRNCNYPNPYISDCQAQSPPRSPRDTCWSSGEQRKVAHGVDAANPYTRVNRDERSIELAVSQGPVSVSIYVERNFHSHAAGIYDGPCTSDKSNHAVAIVGYTQDYWIVRNSWGTEKHENGYIRMKRGINGTNGICGINRKVYYPNIQVGSAIQPLPPPALGQQPGAPPQSSPPPPPPPLPTLPGCHILNASVFAAAAGDTITSINFPEDYINNLDGILFIRGPAEFRMSQFHLEDGDPTCTYDFFEFQGQRYCGQAGGRLSFPTNATQRIAAGTFERIRFKTDHSVVKSGFRMTCRAVVRSPPPLPSPPRPPPSSPPPPPHPTTAGCHVTDGLGTALTTSGGRLTTIQSINHPNKYNDNIDGEITVIGPAQFMFIEFELESHHMCDFDYLTINGQKKCGATNSTSPPPPDGRSLTDDGPFNGRPDGGPFDSASSAPPIKGSSAHGPPVLGSTYSVAAGDIMLMQFHTDESITFRGFWMLCAIHESPPPPLISPPLPPPPPPQPTQPGCHVIAGNGLVRAYDGAITTINFPSNYTDSINGQILVIPPTELVFSHFEYVFNVHQRKNAQKMID